VHDGSVESGGGKASCQVNLGRTMHLILTCYQWIPELELLIVASQKGMVALVRVLRIDLGDDEDEYVFNREAYLPHSQQRSSPLYGTFFAYHC
jgi:hypothetical protein